MFFSGAVLRHMWELHSMVADNLNWLVGNKVEQVGYYNKIVFSFPVNPSFIFEFFVSLGKKVLYATSSL